MIFNIVFGVVAILFVLDIAFCSYDLTDAAKGYTQKEYDERGDRNRTVLLIIIVLMAIITKFV